MRETSGQGTALGFALLDFLPESALARNVWINQLPLVEGEWKRYLVLSLERNDECFAFRAPSSSYRRHCDPQP